MSRESSLKVKALKYNILSAFSALEQMRVCSKPVTALVLVILYG